MSFQLMDITFARGYKHGFNMTRQNGDVQATCASDTDFIFSTVDAEKDDEHPVSGNRGFGLKDNLDGTWSFYSMGADRLTDDLINKVRIPQLSNRGKDVFELGEDFWISFYGELSKKLGNDGLEPQALFRNSCRYKTDGTGTPLGTAAGPPECTKR